ncbi:MAG: hypothetical protein ACYS3S_17520 [Planctomycetota bacterium]|jgi:hypothetical protein
MPKAQEHSLKIGESALLKRGFMTKVTLIYAGIPNDKVYSLVVSRSAGHNSLAYNLYIPIDQRQIEISNIKLTMERVSPNEIHFRTG